MDIFLASLISSVLLAAIPLVLAGMGELITEKSGVLNLGVEGMMLMGAVSSFAVTLWTGSAWLGVLTGVLVGMLAAFLFAFLVVRLLTNQVATGLALTILTTGLSALLGIKFVGQSVEGFSAVSIPVLSEIPVVGEFFKQSILAYVSIALVVFLAWWLYHTHSGLLLRAVGESPHSAHAIGFNVVKVRYAATVLGGALSGLAGAFIALVQFKAWQEGITGGVGWIAVALVVFATWHPSRLIFGALLFGLMRSMGFAVQAANASVQELLERSSAVTQSVLGFLTNSQVLNALPYIATVVILCWISRDWQKIKLNAPASLGQIYND
ncbi:ABC transporter permease [Hydromonas duriensis]|uniref:Nucleoside ABC transporter membrane protein n=1 Tax=Hydromonas duriensis TaxID=1527608 RepID=A0A4R6Y7Q8_9BURK|nr:ABC transporter permease [Hydromonas duriensis]TDR31382.1 nucleoside ABC transporter membrane protein [Hydromonas duriensis]